MYNSYATTPPSVLETIEKAVRKWNEEYKNVYSTSVIDSLPRAFSDIGHYTQMMKENSCFVGCCAVRWVSSDKTYQYWVCNYSYSNMLDQPVFERGETASKCTEGPHEYYTGLCASNEEFDITSTAKKSPTKLKNGKNGGWQNNGRSKLKTGGGGGYHHVYYHRYH